MKLFKRFKGAERTGEDFGKHELDFEHRCKWRDQIVDIGEGTGHGDGEEVKVAMQSGRIGVFKLYSECYNYTFEDTGQKNWRYHFVKYEEPS